MTRLIDIRPLPTDQILNEYNDYGDGIPYNDLKDIMKLIKRGAHDPSLYWANAMELVKVAYEIVEVELPVPSIEDRWEDFEKMLKYAVEQLQKATEKGIRDSSWKTAFGIVNNFHSGA